MVTEQQVAAVTAEAVGRVLDINPVLLRPDTPLDTFGCDSVALIAIADALGESGLTISVQHTVKSSDIVTFGDLLAVVGSKND